MNLVPLLAFFGIGFIGSFLSGLIGMGGAIITYPLLLYIPEVLGLSALSPHQVSGMVTLQVTSAALAGLYAMRSRRLVQFSLVAYMGCISIVGSFCGGYGAQFLPGYLVNVLYATLATVAAIMMFVPKRAGEAASDVGHIRFHRGIALGIASVIGVLSGIVGVGGGFLMIPAMVWILNIPLRMAIGCSMAITLLSSVATSVAKLLTLNIPLLPTSMVVAASIVAAPIGARLALRLNPTLLKSIAGLIIFIVAAKIWFDSI